MVRQKLGKPSADEGGSYFESSSLARFTSGCALLDCILGGGWPEGKLVNIVGDSSTGKSLLALEACANFLVKYPNAAIRYVETESAFEPDYAKALGVPVDSIDLVDDLFTVEAVFKHMEECLKQTEKTKVPGLYIVDSLDALSDEAELGREIDEGSYSMTKAKKISELLRRVHSRLSHANITVMIISQVRDNIGVSFGSKLIRSGGKALKFYAAIELWLAHVGRVEKTIKGVKRPIGVKIKSTTRKNRVGPPFREAEFEILFNYGIDDVKANLTWLDTVDRLDAATDAKDLKTALRRIANSVTPGKRKQESEKVAEAVKIVWREIESEFAPKYKKY